ncbi:MAG TPA: hypothetical protein VK601_31045, partial [Kofleriaceae bacterium]|nr:hypothetical protein [Kofleriaceae bacterium]
EPDDHDHATPRPLVDLDDTLKTRAGIVYGTPGFMAPEQLRGAPVDEMMKAAVAAPPTPIRELVSGVPPDLSTIVDKALAHDPTTRYQDARALAADLQRFLTGQLVASHHYTPREKLIRLIRNNRGVSAAIAVLIVLGTAAVIRIYIERNRADRAAHVAEAQRAEAERRAEELTLTQARYDVELNPTRAVMMVKPLAAKYWREVRAIGAAAHAAGVAWSLPAAAHTRSLQLSRNGTRAVSAGADGVVRLHDLIQRTTQPVADLHAEVMARFADGDRRIVAWHDTQLVILDPATGQRRELLAPGPIHDLEVIGTTAWWVDRGHALWRFELAGKAPVAVALDEPVTGLTPSPDGRWIALAGARHLFLLDLAHPADPAREMMLGTPREIAWSASSEFLAALLGDTAIAYQMVPDPELIQRRTVGPAHSVALRDGRLWVLGVNGVVIIGHDDDDRRSISGAPVGIVEARGGTMIAGASDGLTVISDDGDRVLPLPAARVERVVASARSPYLLAQLEGRLLLWNLDDIQPRRLSDQPTGRALFADPEHLVAGGTLDLPAQLIDLAAGTAQALGAWQDLRAVTAAGPGRAVAIIDGDHRVHLAIPGREPEDLPGEVDIAGFATDTQLVLASLDGQVAVHDVATGRRTPLVRLATPLLGMAWGHGHHPWVAAAGGDGTLWRRNLVTGATATVRRVPAIAAGHPTP